MKFWVTVIVGVVLLTAISTAMYVANPDLLSQAPAHPAGPVIKSDPNAKMPKAVAKVTQEKLDNLPQLKQGESFFEVANEGAADLELTPGRPSCTCLGTSIEKSKLAPGEKTRFVVKWDTKDRHGQYSVSAPLSTNDPTNNQIIFTLHLTVKPDILSSPESLYMGIVRAKSAIEKPILVYSGIYDDLKITDPKPTSPALAASVVPLTKNELKDLEAKSGAKILVKLVGDMPVGAFLERVNYKTNLTRTPEGMVTVSGTVEGAISVTPDRVDFETVSQKGGASKSVRVFAKGIDPKDKLEVLKVEPEFVRATIVKAPDYAVLWKLTADLQPNAPVGPFKGRISIGRKSGEILLIVPVYGVISASVQTASRD